MRTTIIFALMASALATPGFTADPARGVTEVNVPVITRADYAFDAAAPDGTRMTVAEAPGKQVAALIAVGGGCTGRVLR